MPPDDADVLVIGGGLAGTAAAIRLARAGRRVTLLERESQPHHKVCGEFLSAEALEYLQLLGVDVSALGAVDIWNVRFCGNSAQLPFAAKSLTRKALDEALLRAACAAGANVLRGAAVRELQRSSEGWSVLTGDGTSMRAETVFLATGKHDLRPSLRSAGKQSNLTGFKMYFRLSAEQAEALDGNVELFLFRGGYAGLQMVERGAANLAWVVEKNILRNHGGKWTELLEAMQQESPDLAMRLKGAEPLLERPLAISPIPYGFVRGHTEPGLWCVGDQAAVIPSFTGDGMSIALHSGILAAAMYLEGSASQEFQSRLREQVKGQVAFATWISRAMVHSSGQVAMRGGARLFPGALRLIASRTRLSI